MTQPRKAGREKDTELRKTETVTIRLDPQLRYLAALASRRQHTSLNGFIEWALRQAIAHLAIRESPPRASSMAIAALWHEDALERLIMLALSCPELLTHTEQVQWKRLRETCPIFRKETTAGQEHQNPSTSVARDDASHCASP